MGKFLREPAVLALSGLHRTTMREAIKRDEFPRSYKLSDTGRAVGWLESEIAAWMDERIRARAAPKTKNALARADSDNTIQSAKHTSITRLLQHKSAGRA